MSDADRSGNARSPDRAAFVIAAVLLLISITIAWSTATGTGAANYSPVGPKTVPFIIAGCLFGLSILTAIAAARGDFPDREHQDFGPMVWILGGLAVQLLLMKTVGFSVATGLLFAATARGFGRGPLWLTVPVGIVFSFLVWFAFAKGLQLSLPVGPLEKLF